MSFLKAEWRKLALANYSIDPAILKPFIPAKTELDLWNGQCYVSLVAFMFKNTKLLGLKIPFHTNFEEVNLRFYVRHRVNGEWRRGVGFIKEIVPRHAITLVANSLYGENYSTMKMKHSWLKKNEALSIDYQWKYQGVWQKFSLNAEKEAAEIAIGSEAEFITEHYFGYTRKNENTTYEYEVTHPRWQQYLLKDYTIEVDFGLVYGAEFNLLNSQKPVSVMLAEGSLITVENKRKL